MNGNGSEAIIANTLQRGPEISFGRTGHGWRFSRWRQFVGSYTLPALPAPMFVVQLAGKTDVRVWERDRWSEATSFPGAATIVPAGQSSRWLVDGELDVATFSLDALRNLPGQVSRFDAMRFAYADPLGAALSDQILSELYAGADAGSAYVETLADTLGKHVLRPSIVPPGHRYPVSNGSSFRVHAIMNAILRDPAKDHGLQELADRANITPTHLCRVFKQSVGMSPHQYVLSVRLDRAKELLGRRELSIGRVAELAGFQGQGQFARTFLKRFGLTPSRYRERTGD